MTILDEIGASIRQLAEGAGASVVGIGQRWGTGSGIVLGEGQVLTNAHNVRGDHATVTFADGRTAEGSVTGHDIDSDLAVISVDTGETPALPWASSASVEIGKPVFALANPADEALRGRADALARGETATSPRLGVAIAPGHVARRLRRAVGLPDTEGLLIREVVEASPAARAGLAQGDLIVAAAGQPANTPDDLFDALAAARGGTLELKAVRGTDERTLQVTFTEPDQTA